MERRLPHIDGLRAFAILSVVAFHAVQHAPLARAAMHPFVYAMLTNSHGVELFFVLSGYCLAHPIIERYRNDGIAGIGLARYAAKRLVRILPPFYIAAGLFFSLWVVLHHAGIATPEAMARNVTPADVVKHVLLWDRRPHWIDGSYWTLPLEVRWYVCFPVLMAVWFYSRRAFATLAVVCWLATYETRFFSVDGLVLPAFMFGIVAADIHARGRSAAWISLAAFTALLGLAIAFGKHGWTNPFWEAAMGALVVTAGSVPAFKRLFSSRLLLPISTTSYGIYLVHEPLVAWLDRAVGNVLAPLLAVTVVATIGVLAGMAFASVADRPFARGAFREAIVARVQQWFAVVFKACGLPSAIAFGAKARGDVTPSVADRRLASSR